MTGRIFAELIFSGGVITNIIFLHFLIFAVLHHQRLYLFFFDWAPEMDDDLQQQQRY